MPPTSGPDEDDPIAEDRSVTTQRDLDRLTRAWGPQGAPPESAWVGSEAVRVRQTPEAVLVDVRAAGFAREQIDVEVDDGVLWVTAEQRLNGVDVTPELRAGRIPRVEQAIRLPAPVEAASLQVRLADGVLHVELARRPPGDGET